MSLKDFLLRTIARAVQVSEDRAKGGIRVSPRVKKKTPWGRIIRHQAVPIVDQQGNVVGHIDHFFHATKGWRSRRRPAFRRGVYPIGA